MVEVCFATKEEAVTHCTTILHREKLTPLPTYMVRRRVLIRIGRVIFKKR